MKHVINHSPKEKYHVECVGACLNIDKELTDMHWRVKKIQ